jgi:hypothetical protein
MVTAPSDQASPRLGCLLLYISSLHSTCTVYVISMIQLNPKSKETKNGILLKHNR